MKNPILLEGAFLYLLTIVILLKMLILKAAVECAKSDAQLEKDYRKDKRRPVCRGREE